jgi:hypothetical protein
MVCVACAVMGVAQAKLPAPSEDQKAKAEEAKAKAAATTKLEGEQLGKAQDRAVDYYRKEKGKAAAPAAVKTATVVSGTPKK